MYIYIFSTLFQLIVQSNSILKFMIIEGRKETRITNCLNFSYTVLCVKILLYVITFEFQMCLADANLSFPVHSLTIKRSGQDSPKECKEVNLSDCN